MTLLKYWCPISTDVRYYWVKRLNHKTIYSVVKKYIYPFKKSVIATQVLVVAFMMMELWVTYFYLSKSSNFSIIEINYFIFFYFWLCLDMQDLNSPPGIEPVPLHCKHRVLTTVFNFKNNFKAIIFKIIFFLKKPF